ncbi:hypothetical protein Bbelb_041590 [Branchiostoma belcheri]|nr:hypothetical protein Bbelb_041590 [Branchiostoma belcheri]
MFWDDRFSWSNFSQDTTRLVHRYALPVSPAVLWGQEDTYVSGEDMPGEQAVGTLPISECFPKVPTLHVPPAFLTGKSVRRFLCRAAPDTCFPVVVRGTPRLPPCQETRVPSGSECGKVWESHWDLNRVVSLVLAMQHNFHLKLGKSCGIGKELSAVGRRMAFEGRSQSFAVKTIQVSGSEKLEKLTSRGDRIKTTTRPWSMTSSLPGVSWRTWLQLARCTHRCLPHSMIKLATAGVVLIKGFPVPHTPVKFAVSWSRPWISGLRVYGPGYFLTLPDSCSPCTCTEIYAPHTWRVLGAANNKGLSESSEKKERKATAVTQKRARLEANRQTAHPGSDLKARAPTTQAGPAALPPGVHPAPSTPLRPDCDHNRHQHHAIPQTDSGQFVLPG